MIFNWFRKKPKQVLIHRPVCTLTLDEWRAEPVLVRRAEKILSMPEVIEMIEVLRNSHYANYALTPSCGVEARAMHQCKCEGYGTALDNLASLGKSIKLMDQLEPTFEKPETET